MNILFWNTKGNKKINPYLISLVKELNIDILVLAEYSADESELSYSFENLYFNGVLLKRMKKIFSEGCKRIKIWSSINDISPAIQEDYYSVQVLYRELILCGVHYPSDLHGDFSDERLNISKSIMVEIEKLKSEINSKYVLFIGDFNDMPYGKCCLNANGLHGLPFLSISEASNRQVLGKKYDKYYNPMWNLLGDYNWPPGTYFYNSSKLCAPMWYMLDQVILSQKLIPYFNKDSLKIVTNIGKINLTNDKGRPDPKISDHFPILCELNIEN